MGERKLRGTFCVALALVLLACPFAWGSAQPGTAHIIQVQATSGGHSALFWEAFPVSNFNEILPWTLPAPLTLADGDFTLGTVQNLAVTFNADPQVDLSFALTNGSSSAVNFQISTATIIFDEIPNAEGLASASITLTNGQATPGASITGGFPDGKIYQARYSTDSMLNTQTAFGSLVPSLSHSWGASATEQLPATGMSQLGSSVYMMESEFKFTLSAGDHASGTSTFIITPEPASLLLLALGACLLRRR